MYFQKNNKVDQNFIRRRKRKGNFIFIEKEYVKSEKKNYKFTCKIICKKSKASRILQFNGHTLTHVIGVAAMSFLPPPSLFRSKSAAQNLLTVHANGSFYRSKASWQEVYMAFFFFSAYSTTVYLLVLLAFSLSNKCWFEGCRGFDFLCNSIHGGESYCQ